MRKYLALFYTLAVAIPTFSQVISDADLLNAVKTIEAFLNDKPYFSIYHVISVHEWSPYYHNGYSPRSENYLLNRYPYRVDPDLSIPEGGMSIIISVSPEKDAIIVDLLFPTTSYGFYSDLENNAETRIKTIPYGLHEGD